MHAYLSADAGRTDGELIADIGRRATVAVCVNNLPSAYALLQRKEKDRFESYVPG